MNTLLTAFSTLLSTMFNQKNVTNNNLSFLTGTMVILGLITYGILSFVMGGFLAFITIAIATAIMGYRTFTKNEELPMKDRTTATTRSTY